MKHLIFNVNSQSLQRLDNFKPAAGSVEYLTASFSFTSDWSGTTKTAKCRTGGVIYDAVISSDGSCTIPWEVLAVDTTQQIFGKQDFYVWVEGVSGSKTITTDEIKIELNVQGAGSEQNAGDPTESVYAQFVTEVKAETKASADTATAKATEAEASAESAAASAASLKNDYSNALKGNASGAVVRIDDVSPVEHYPSVKAYSKNLCSMDAFKNMTSNGAANTYDAETYKITVNADTALSNFTGQYCRPLGYSFNVGTTYTISFDIKGTAGKIVSCGWDTGRTEITLTETFTRYKATKKATRADEVISFYSIATQKGGLATGEYMQFGNVQIETGETMTDYTEYVDPSIATIKSCGKNLCPPMGSGKTATINGITFTGKESGGLNVSGTPTAMARYELYHDKAVLKSGFITLSLFGTFSNIIWDFQLLDSEKNIIKHTQTADVTTINLSNYPDTVYWNIGIKRQTDNVAVWGTIYPQIEIGEKATAYEPYNSADYTPNESGAVEGLTSLSPTMTLLSDTDNVVIECEYNRDLNKVIADIFTKLAGG